MNYSINNKIFVVVILAILNQLKIYPKINIKL